jgi:hypothetical protein
MKAFKSNSDKPASQERPPSLQYLHGKLDSLTDLLLEKERLLRCLRGKDFGPRITDPEEAGRFLSRISECTRDVLGVSAKVPEPELQLRHNLSRLPRQTLKSYLFFVPLCLILGIATASQGFRTSLTYPIVFSALTLLLLIPLLVHRRTRLHLEHQCHYVRANGKGTIMMDELESIPFQSYLAHEYAHHLLFSLSGEPQETWTKEGWARLVQWRVVSRLAEEEGNPAYLHHALFQIVSELKFICILLACFHHRRLPRKIRRIRTLYHSNPLFRLITGTPGFHAERLLEHALGTAVFFLDCRKGAVDEVYCHPELRRMSVEGVEAAP